MISAGDFRNGITIELEGNIYQIMWYNSTSDVIPYIVVLSSDF